MTQHSFSRRGLLAAGTGVGLGALGALGALGTAHAASAAPVAGDPLAGDPLGSGRRFDLTKPSSDLFLGRALYDHTVMQSFTFDNVRHRLYVAQVADGAGKSSGNLCLTRFLPERNSAGGTSWRAHGHMYLRGFGHGVAIAAHDGTLWTEYNSAANAKKGLPVGYGRQLCTFPFTDGTVLSGNPDDDPRLSPRTYDPLPGSTAATCAVDPVNEHLIMRFLKDGKQHIAVYRLRDMRPGPLPKPVVEPFTMPKLGDGGGEKEGLVDDFQGYTAYGRYLYCLTGEADRPEGHGPNTRLWCIDMRTHELLTRKGVPSHAGQQRLTEHREPEGMAIYRSKKGARLFFGFADGKARHNGHGGRNANLFYKSVFL